MSGRKTKALRLAVACGPAVAAPLIAGMVSSGKIDPPSVKQLRRALRIAKREMLKAVARAEGRNA